MKLLAAIICLSPAIICFSIAGYLCVAEKDHWGWFLLAGMVIMTGTKISFE